MSKGNKSMKAFLPGLGIVVGVGAGLLVSILSNIQITIGVVGGAALGLVIALGLSNLYDNKL